MSIKGKGVLLAVGALGLVLAGAGPALAQGHAGGGGHAGGHSGGGGHAAVGHFGGGAHFAGPGHFAGGGHYAGGGHVAMAYHGGAYAAWGRLCRPRVCLAATDTPPVGAAAAWGGWRGSAWRGGYWRGGFWPGAFYGPGFAWFLPILPLAYATYWYGGIPYYYANDVYYTWNPTYDGYVATDPPPVADSTCQRLS